MQKNNISYYVAQFAKRRAAENRPVFHMNELTHYVKGMTGTAPDSPGRLLRQLRQKGIVNYVVVNRASSLYCLEGV